MLSSLDSCGKIYCHCSLHYKYDSPWTSGLPKCELPFLQVSSWPAFKSFLEAFSQKAYGLIARAFVASSLGPSTADPSKPWTPSPAMMRVSMGLLRTEHSVSRDLDNFVEECSNWVSLAPTSMCLLCKMWRMQVLLEQAPHILLLSSCCRAVSQRQCYASSQFL